MIPKRSNSFQNLMIIETELFDFHKICIRAMKMFYSSTVIWQKGESENGGNKNTKQAKFSEKRTFFTP